MVISSTPPRARPSLRRYGAGTRLRGKGHLTRQCLLAGCSGGGSSKITQENYDKVKDGMTKAEVTAILGEPTGSETVGEVQDTKLNASVWQGRGLKIVIGFDDDGKLLAKRLDKE
jgi:hypothetical protein